jgi:hypothetical protein
MGQPLETTAYGLCIYDATGVKLALGVPAGPGWAFLGSPGAPRGYQYKDRTAAIAGIRQIKLQGSSLPRASLKLQAKGERARSIRPRAATARGASSGRRGRRHQPAIVSPPDTLSTCPVT